MLLENGTHIIIDIYDIENNHLLKYESHIYEILDKIVTNFDLHIVNKVFHQFEPYGVTGVYVLAESHLSIHTFVDERKVAMDVYTCKKMDNTDKIIKYIQSLFGECKIKSCVIER
jgi:S-adenosylmethionine decarboxylase